MAVDEERIVEMIDEDNNVLEFELLLDFEYEDNFYIAFTPLEDTDDCKVGEVLIMRVREEGDDEEIYEPLESEDELNRLWEVFQILYYADEDDADAENEKLNEDDEDD